MLFGLKNLGSLILKSSQLSALVEYIYNIIVTYIPSRRIRKFYLRAFIGRIENSTAIMIGARFKGLSNIYLSERSVINYQSLLDGRGGRLIIAHDTDVAEYATVWTLSHATHDGSHQSIGSPTYIGHHCWIGARAMIMPGSHVGDNTVIGALSLLTKPAQSNSVFCGIPAKYIASRNSPDYQLNYYPRFK